MPDHPPEKDAIRLEASPGIGGNRSHRSELLKKTER